MNHRPLGYEPNELPDCSTPRTYGSVGLPTRQIFAAIHHVAAPIAAQNPNVAVTRSVKAGVPVSQKVREVVIYSIPDAPR